MADSQPSCLMRSSPSETPGRRARLRSSLPHAAHLCLLFPPRPMYLSPGFIVSDFKTRSLVWVALIFSQSDCITLPLGPCLLPSPLEITNPIMSHH